MPWRGWRVPLSLAVVLALVGGGCSYRLESLFFRDKADTSADITGTIPVVKAVESEPIAETDLVHARNAATEVMGRTGKDISQPWENPATGARGTVTPLAHAYESAGHVCRDFLASYVRNRAEIWMQGEACQMGEGRWEVRSMKPWKRS